MMSDFVQNGDSNLFDDFLAARAGHFDVSLVDGDSVRQMQIAFDAALGHGYAMVKPEDFRGIVNPQFGQVLRAGHVFDFNHDVFQILPEFIRYFGNRLPNALLEFRLCDFHDCRRETGPIDAFQQTLRGRTASIALRLTRACTINRRRFIEQTSTLTEGNFDMITRSTIRPLALLTLAAALVATGTLGCRAPSLLITPVSGKRELVETEVLRSGTASRDKIVLIEVSGMIRNSDSGFILNPRDNPVSVLLEHLDKATRDQSVKGVILRINSPGGTVVASELMHQEIMHFRNGTQKPVVAVMMDMATSGGYYIACACDEIVAHPSTVTGSIGVLMLMFDATGTMNKIGLRTDAITSGKFKDAGSPFRTMRPEERDHFQGMVLDMYERFVKVVMQGRPKLGEEAVRKLADGRVYTAGQALDAGLIDRIGSLREATDSLREKLDVKGVRLVTYHRAHEYTPNYYAQAPSQPATANYNFLNVNVPGSLLPRPPEFLYLWAPEYTGD